jgi:hypothetical protein
MKRGEGPHVDTACTGSVATTGSAGILPARADLSKHAGRMPALPVKAGLFQSGPDTVDVVVIVERLEEFAGFSALLLG